MNNYYILAMLVFLTGCVGHYRYSATSQLETYSGVKSPSVIYWFADQGVWASGIEYNLIDGDITLNACGIFPKTFVLTEEDKNRKYTLFSQSGDTQVVEVSERVEVKKLIEPTRLKVGSECGYIHFIEDNETRIDLSYLCKSGGIDDDVLPGSYSFSNITKVKVDGNVPPELNCP
ncbi:MAG: hypothetical protein P8X74_07950 [Reinekea sp.]|jgi:hypothetical protein